MFEQIMTLEIIKNRFLKKLKFEYTQLNIAVYLDTQMSNNESETIYGCRILPYI